MTDDEKHYYQTTGRMPIHECICGAINARHCPVHQEPQTTQSIDGFKPTPKPTGAPREWTYYNCTQQEMMVAGIRTDGKCHHCKEVVHVIEKSYATHFEVLARRQLTEIAALKAELADYKSFVTNLSRHVIPGELDSIDRLTQIIHEHDALTAENRRLREALELHHRVSERMRKESE